MSNARKLEKVESKIPHVEPLKNLSFADVLHNNKSTNKRKVNFRGLESEQTKHKGIDEVFSQEVVQETSERFACTIFGYFIGSRLPFPVVDRYVGNVWKIYGLEKAMMSTSGFYYFKFSSEEEVVRVLEERTVANSSHYSE